MGGFMIGAGMVGSFIGLGMMVIACILKYFTDYGFEYWSWYFFYGMVWVFGAVSIIALGASTRNSMR